MNKAKPEDVKFYQVGFTITRISTDYAQKLPEHSSGDSIISKRAPNFEGKLVSHKVLTHNDMMEE